MLRHLHPTASAFLLDLYRLIFIRETLSSIWRKSIVVHIPKQGKDPMVDSNQRTISMICNTCKVMEKMVANRLLWKLEALGALSAYQFGFRRFLSSSDPLLMLEQNIRQAFKEKRVLLGVFFDLEKAYDSTRSGDFLS